MSEESSTDVPGSAAPGAGGEPVPVPEEPPRRNRRTVLILSCAAAISVAMIATAVVWSVGHARPAPTYSQVPYSPGPAYSEVPYSHVPAPCSLVSLATLTRYLPHPRGTPQRTPTLSGVKAVSCSWTGTTGGEARSVGAVVFVFGSSPGVSATYEAQQSYSGTISADRCRCQGITVSTQPVRGLGDQATALFITGGPDANFLTTPNLQGPEAILLVRSGNALIAVSYTVTDTATLTTIAPRTDAAQVTGLVLLARDVLAALARPAAAAFALAPIAPASAEPHYALQRDPCRLITMATLATYAPGATVFPLEAPSGNLPQTGVCSWGVNGANGISLTLNLYSGASSAQQSFTTDAQGLSQSGAGITVTGAQWLLGLGEGAAAIFQTDSGAHLVRLLLWSGNAELDVSYYGPGGRAPDRATLLAGGIAITRDALSALGNPAASGYLQGPVYRSPNDACTLIRSATVATYLPGATASPIANSLSNGCGWTGVNGSLSLFVTVYPDADSALGGFESDLQSARQEQTGLTFDGAQPVKALGQQATAILETFVGSPEVALYVLSGNAEIEVDFTDTPFNGPQPSRAAVLAADIVMAREVLAHLPR